MEPRRRERLPSKTPTRVFDASRPFLPFDYFRIPYRTSDRADPPEDDPLRRCGWVRLRLENGEQRTLYWPAEADHVDGDLLPAAGYRLGSIPFHAALVPDETARAWLGVTANNGWRPTETVEDGDGRRVASVWRDERGSVFLPFDPEQAIRSYWSEGYRDTTSGRFGLLQGARRAYYRARPLVPRRAQYWFRSQLSRVQARARFPRWPVEPGLHDLYDFLLRLTADVAGEPVPWLGWWPAGYSWAIVLTHDVEQEVGLRNLESLRDLERGAGYRSSWNFVPRRYEVDDAVLAGLVEEGCEVGVHGLYHDGRDFASRALFDERLPEIREYAERWGAKGFRAPSLHREWEWMPRLGFDYDSSYPDTDPFEPYPGGCCSWLPFFNEDLVELPVTLPQDHTLFVILSATDERVWVDKSREIRRRGGMALLNVHPDYIYAGATLQAFERYLSAFEDDPTVWRPLPREVSAWWRRRAASSIRRTQDGWELVGPARGEGAVQLASP
jgi:hypothetical protein